MKKTFGILGLLIVVFLATAYMADSFLTPFNLENLIRRTSLFGIISIGVAFVIITGGIDLSIGSVVCLIGCGLPFLLHVDYTPNHQATLAEINAAQSTIADVWARCDACSSRCRRFTQNGVPFRLMEYLPLFVAVQSTHSLSSVI